MSVVIGITSFVDNKNGRPIVSLGYGYVNSVLSSGGTPIVFPVINDEESIDMYLDCVDGLIFTGGADLNPKEYTEEPIQQLGAFSSQRDEFELHLLEKAIKRDIPVLGICRGCQLINVYFGGSLYQDIHVQVNGALGHSPEKAARDELHHNINIVQDSMLSNIMAEDKIRVNSFHHQAIKRLGEHLKISAKAKDGIVEAIESEDYLFLLGVQWHPEELTAKYDNFKKLFKALVQKSEEYKNKKNS